MKANALRAGRGVRLCHVPGDLWRAVIAWHPESWELQKMEDMEDDGRLRLRRRRGEPGPGTMER